MSVIYILIPIAILLSAIGIYIFFWAVKTEQFDDLEKQGMSILFDDLKAAPQVKNAEQDPLKENNHQSATNDKPSHES
jgi:cbb3-type cytochrome oxidase maturation protein